jgi:ELWxxDGT repeat protein
MSESHKKLNQNRKVDETGLTWDEYETSETRRRGKTKSKSPALHRAAAVLGVVLILAALGLAPMPSLGTSSAQSSTCPPPPAGYTWEYLGTFLGPDTHARMTRFRDGLFFEGRSGDEYGLWVTDGTLWGTHLVWGVSSGGRLSGSSITAFRNKLFFSAYGELWATDGTTEGTREWMDINPSGDSDPEGLTVAGPQLFFSADDGTHGRELWAMESSWWPGWEPEPYLVKDILPGEASSRPRSLTAFDDRIFFWVDDGTGGEELWATDGTQAGTCLISDKQAPARYEPTAFGPPIKGALVLWTRTSINSPYLLYALRPHDLPPADTPTPVLSTPTDTPFPPTPTDTPFPPTPTDTPFPPTPTPLPPTNTPTPVV